MSLGLWWQAYWYVHTHSVGPWYRAAPKWNTNLKFNYIECIWVLKSPSQCTNITLISWLYYLFLIICYSTILYFSKLFSIPCNICRKQVDLRTLTFAQVLELTLCSPHCRFCLLFNHKSSTEEIVGCCQLCRIFSSCSPILLKKRH